MPSLCLQVLDQRRGLARQLGRRLVGDGGDAKHLLRLRRSHRYEAQAGEQGMEESGAKKAVHDGRSGSALMKTRHYTAEDERAVRTLAMPLPHSTGAEPGEYVVAVGGKKIAIARMPHVRLSSRTIRRAARGGRRTRAANSRGTGAARSPDRVRTRSPSTPRPRPSQTPRAPRSSVAAHSHSASVGKRRPAQRHQAAASCAVMCRTGAPDRASTHSPKRRCCNPSTARRR